MTKCSKCDDVAQKWTFGWSNLRPKGPQDGPKISPRSPQNDIGGRSKTRPRREKTATQGEVLKVR